MLSTIVGLGIPGTQQGGVLTVQGDPAGTPIPVTLGGGGVATEVEGLAANGAAPSGNPVWVAGYDGAAIRAFLTDTSGRQFVVGPDANGAAATGNPLRVGGWDGANLRTLLTDTSGRQVMVGASASGAAVSGNPVLIGGSDGVNAQVINVDSSGAVRLQSGGTPGAAAPTRATQIGGSDGVNLRTMHMANFTSDASALDDAANQSVNTLNGLFNGSTWDRRRNNFTSTLLASATRTATTDSADVTNFNGRGIHVTLVVTAASGSGGLSIQIQARDPVSGNYYQMNQAPTLVTATGTNTYEIYPGATGGAVAGGVVQRTAGVVPRTFRVRVLHGDPSNYTYSVGLCVIN